MLDRRQFATLLVLAPATAAARSPVLRRRPTATIWNGELAGGPGRGIVATVFQTTPRHGKLFAKLKPRELTLLSQRNDNTQYLLWVALPKQKDGHWQFLELDGIYYQADSTGGDHRGSIATFTLDRTIASRAAAALGIPLLHRTQLDQGLRYRWTIPSTVSVTSTSPVPAVLHVENVGNTTVGFMIGGRQRGPRDNRFSFVVSRNGAAVPIKVAHDFGGPGTYKALAPGDRVDVTCADVRAWFDLDQPGHYTIEAAYEGELVKDGKMPNTAAERANVWDIRATGQAAIVVK